MRMIVLAVAGMSSLLGGAVAADQPTGISPRCHVGAYRLDDGGAVDIGVSDPQLRWRRPDGTSGSLTEQADHTWASTLGWTGRPDNHRIAFGDCASNRIDFDGVQGHRMDLVTSDVTFENGGVPLAGRLVLPPGNSRVPLVVLVHGSEQSSAREYFALQRQFPAAGIGAFVYDKRGTGDSKGTFTHDYHVLASDAAAAVREARRLAGARAGRVGLQGSSQGGWVAPLAATLTPVDFVLVGYGLAVSPLDEDREAVTLDMTRHGYGAEEIRKALEVAGAAEAIVLSGFASGYEALDAVRERYVGEPWFHYVRGNVTGILLSQPRDWLREQGPVVFAGILPNYDPMPVLRSLRTPQLWILGADDIDAPPGETLRRLAELRRAGKPIAVAVYPRAEHGMYEYEIDSGGERQSTRQPASYFRLMVDFVRRGRIRARYDDAQILR